MGDDLLEIKRQLDALRPVNYVDIILSTRCPIPPEEMIRAEYKDRAYLIVYHKTMQKIASQFQQKESSSLFPLFPVRVVENEKLVAEILSVAYVQQPARMTKKEVGIWIAGSAQREAANKNLDAIKAWLEHLLKV